MQLSLIIIKHYLWLISLYLLNSNLLGEKTLAACQGRNEILLRNSQCGGKYKTTIEKHAALGNALDVAADRVLHLIKVITAIPPTKSGKSA